MSVFNQIVFTAIITEISYALVQKETPIYYSMNIFITRELSKIWIQDPENLIKEINFIKNGNMNMHHTGTTQMPLLFLSEIITFKVHQ